MNTYKKAALLSYIKLSITNIGGIIITPYIIKMLGNEEYGLYTLIGAFVGYLSILDLGLNNAIVRYVAKYKAQKDKKGEANFLAISLLIYAGIGVLLVLFGIIFYFNVDNLFRDTLNFEQLQKAKWMLIILIINLGFTLPGGAFTGICTGYEAFVFPRILSIAKYVLRVIMVVAILNLGADALGIVILDSILNLGFILVTLWYVLKKLDVKFKLKKFEWVYVKDIFSYSIWIFIFGLVYQFQWRSGQVILGTHLDTVTVAIFGIGVMLGIYFTTFGNIINRLILPKAVKSVFNNSTPKVLTEQMTKVARVSLFLLLFVFGGFVVIGKDFIELWVGQTYQNSYYIALLIMVVYIMPIAQGYAHSILEAKKLLKFKTLSFLIASVLGLIIGGYLSYSYAEIGMIIGLVIPLFLLQWVIMNLYYLNKINLNIHSFFKGIFSILLAFTSLILILNYIYSMYEVSWLNFILKAIIYSLFVMIISYLLMNTYEKKIISNRLS
ncbi:oligosaccharide flippase family protein [Psychroflexus tropicus]|uniref:oligosaccharide flippase family protein n=1 Tax=Psychroflexus tropicus TaxID=197345 RepID=UPI0003626CE4|nr:oligosaccharide flippase family protein [Psychroflexus tropicus]